MEVAATKNNLSEAAAAAAVVPWRQCKMEVTRRRNINWGWQQW